MKDSIRHPPKLHAQESAVETILPFEIAKLHIIADAMRKCNYDSSLAALALEIDISTLSRYWKQAQEKLKLSQGVQREVSVASPKTGIKTFLEIRAEVILAAHTACLGNRTLAADRLGIARQTFRNYLSAAGDVKPSIFNHDNRYAPRKYRAADVTVSLQNPEGDLIPLKQVMFEAVQIAYTLCGRQCRTTARVLGIHAPSVKSRLEKCDI